MMIDIGHCKWPSIGQFKNVIHNVKSQVTYDGTDEDGNAVYVDRPLPKIVFDIQTKLHGTCSSVRFNPDGIMTAQSRERDLSLTSDNAGFCLFVYQNEHIFRDIWMHLITEDYTVVIHGEWCGNNIQANVAITKLPKMYVIFGIQMIKDGESTWFLNPMKILSGTKYTKEVLNQYQIFFIDQFPCTQVTVDFNYPELAQNKLVELCQAIEDECPVGKAFGVSGIGEGLVASCVHEEFGLLMFKVKGVLHVGNNDKTKKKILAPVDEERIAKEIDWVNTYVTEGRLQQGIHVMKSEMRLEIIDKNVGKYLQWLCNDVFKEEQQSIIVNEFDPKKLAKRINEVGKRYYFNQL